MLIGQGDQDRCLRLASFPGCCYIPHRICGRINTLKTSGRNHININDRVRSYFIFYGIIYIRKCCGIRFKCKYSCSLPGSIGDGDVCKECPSDIEYPDQHQDQQRQNKGKFNHTLPTRCVNHGSTTIVRHISSFHLSFTAAQTLLNADPLGIGNIFVLLSVLSLT